ncbi:inactive protein kinase SELMODRAFT_444075-like [Salvia miltiorrhiza]|uniref:inactive protein kinase SELMODRAFT_444075-like n=1 Tax=Salvia miltiorrhiza TaxID=226208 RepID=UPI0025AC3C3D|nr:inactive protein kinase SELMODRAFT_444075-like [Salvia miltiorrhiza]XP_057797188.1 inactive protein kinase SELMODRAFT_444075-like [Salvia miltiorrhiza]XP_057797189.1 inactive protein kinase SELMODRAFT_444075-like [Salvia miltiorrhiza]XP_057797190.1 inactive protein kinase SELMODRAFT_444075-like [Salvia miltiorrhiza]XP_057797191.1 inactive protein kinase SELMODRAFT_444075-like [Salvia miltiorrhiza]XP_057797192.1 inactive protein kinase SELMODRAFT_444075-like [Salvia miltiorrhiza]
MSREMGGKQDKVSEVAKVLVAVKAAKEIPRTALIWALTHVVQPGDCITLLVFASSQTSGLFWGFPRFRGDCASRHRRSQSTANAEEISEIHDSCTRMILQLHDVYDPKTIDINIKIASDLPCGAVAAEAKTTQASWVVLDRQLNHEKKHCMEQLQCNIVVMKNSQPKVLRLNLVGSAARKSEAMGSNNDQPSREKESKTDSLSPPRAHLVTPSSSPETFTITEAGTSSISDSDLGNSPFCVPTKKKTPKKARRLEIKQDLDGFGSDSDYTSHSPSQNLKFQPWIRQMFGSDGQSFENLDECRLSTARKQDSATEAAPGKLRRLDKEAAFGSPSYNSGMSFNCNLREVISLSRKAPPGPPPLCSICQHKSPAFGKPPRWFTYAELELATGGFSQANFLAEGGYGSVHRGLLPDGQAVAVKQHKLASSQGDKEFCSEVEVLSCAQHRNVVMLIGFCIEDGRRLLVYEYICNGALDSHLYGRHQEKLSWSARQKIAVGAARGLRYLHEECRVGCIVHRDMRPNNILITHDFEPLVGDFGLARWQADGQKGVDTRVIGTFGYLAPEYTQSGQITEKADVYSFGVVLVELVSGLKAVDLKRPKGQQCLTEWARPLLEGRGFGELVDPRLGNEYLEQELELMLHAACLCLRRDPQARPRMSQVLRILEGDINMMETSDMNMSERGYGPIISYNKYVVSW